MMNAPTRQRRPDLMLISSVSVIALLLFWEAACRLQWVDPLFLPPPSSVYARMAGMWEQGSLMSHPGVRAPRDGGVRRRHRAGDPAGHFPGHVAARRAAFDPILSFLRPLPSMSWIPLSLLWFGITETQKYSIVFMGTFAPALLYVIEATRNIDPLLIRAARNLGASGPQVMRMVILPASLPQIFSGFKVILGLSWTCVISAELVAAKEGLGFLIMNGKEFFQTDTVVLGMALISVTVLITDVVFRVIENRVLAWSR